MSNRVKKRGGWRSRALLSSMAALAAAGCGERSGSDVPEGPESPAGEVALLDYTAPVPESWVAHPPSNEMRLAEFVVPAEGGGEPARVVAYHFGAGQGGSVEANIERWAGQFTAEDGGPVEAEVTRYSGGAFPVTVAELEGTYARGMAMGPDRAEATPGQRLAAAVVETPRGSLFIQLFGPADVVREEREAFLDFVRGVAPADGAAPSGGDRR